MQGPPPPPPPPAPDMIWHMALVTIIKHSFQFEAPPGSSALFPPPVVFPNDESFKSEGEGWKQTLTWLYLQPATAGLDIECGSEKQRGDCCHNLHGNILRDKVKPGHKATWTNDLCSLPCRHVTLKLNVSIAKPHTTSVYEIYSIYSVYWLSFNVEHNVIAFRYISWSTLRIWAFL